MSVDDCAAKCRPGSPTSSTRRPPPSCRAAGRADAGDAAATAELADRFAGPLTFGTAGLRGPLRAGPNGMNRAVVRRAAAGLAAWLTGTGDAGATGGGRLRRPARLAGVRRATRPRSSPRAGFDARLLPRLLPTPVLAFAVRHWARPPA